MREGKRRLSLALGSARSRIETATVLAMNSGRRSCKDMRSFALIRSRMSQEIDRDGIATPFLNKYEKTPELIYSPGVGIKT